ncbi:hypothetical protein ACTJI8_13280 [Microbacterium sp. 22303]|uniref:hypothetical protein n=1 Tax=Microbacterium sp. 22303 TaxID=3453905 RepID=UPI003F83C6E1
MTAAERSSWRRRVLAALVVGACAAALLWPRPTLTDASYSDGEYVASGTVTAATLSDPTNLTCTPTKALNILTGVTVTWQSAYPLSPTTAPISTLTANPSNYSAAISSSGAGPYTHTMVLNQGLLGGILNNVLGSTVTFTVTNQVGTNWHSASLVKTLTTGALGANPHCT